jgi:hypothetical protein
MTNQTPEQFELESAIERWENACEDLAAAKAAESAFRAAVLKLISNGSEFAEGTTNIPVVTNLYPAHKIVVKHPYYYSVDKTVWFEKVVPNLPEHLVRDEALVKIKLDLSVREYRKLSQAHLTFVNRAVTFKPGSPAIELKIAK